MSNSADNPIPFSGGVIAAKDEYSQVVPVTVWLCIKSGEWRLPCPNFCPMKQRGVKSRYELSLRPLLPSYPKLLGQCAEKMRNWFRRENFEERFIVDFSPMIGTVWRYAQLLGQIVQIEIFDSAYRVKTARQSCREVAFFPVCEQIAWSCGIFIAEIWVNCGFLTVHGRKTYRQNAWE